MKILQFPVVWVLTSVIAVMCVVTAVSPNPFVFYKTKTKSLKGIRRVNLYDGSLYQDIYKTLNSKQQNTVSTTILSKMHVLNNVIININYITSEDGLVTICKSPFCGAVWRLCLV